MSNLFSDPLGEHRLASVASAGVELAPIGVSVPRATRARSRSVASPSHRLGGYDPMARRPT